jgi:hypothetical protein
MRYCSAVRFGMAMIRPEWIFRRDGEIGQQLRIEVVPVPAPVCGSKRSLELEMC